MRGVAPSDSPAIRVGATGGGVGETIGAHPLGLLLALGALALLLLGALILGARWMSARGATWRDTLFREAMRDRAPARSRGALARLGTWVRVEYELLHLGLGLAFVLGLVLFGGLAIGLAGEDVVAFDRAVAAGAHDHAPPALVAVMLTVTSLGGADAVIVVAVIVAVALAVTRRFRLAIAWTAAEAGAGALNSLLKALFHRARPSFDPPFASATGWSFPSGHSMGTFVTAGMLAYVVSRLSKRRGVRLGAFFVASVWTLAIGYSRVLLGVHWASDVLAGFAAGAAWLAVCVSAVDVTSRPTPRRSETPSP